MDALLLEAVFEEPICAVPALTLLGKINSRSLLAFYCSSFAPYMKLGAKARSMNSVLPHRYRNICNFQQHLQMAPLQRVSAMLSIR